MKKNPDSLQIFWIDIFSKLSEEILKDSESKRNVFAQARLHNPWYEPKEINRMIQAIAHDYLDPIKLQSWISKYQFQQILTKKVGLITAANIPLVGFHDLLCILISGHEAMVKCSERDKVLYLWIHSLIEAISPEAAKSIHFVERLTDYNAVIATGSDQSASLFKQYFSKVPHLIRSHRNSVAWLNANESNDELLLLGEDVFSYFGLGCRNVSKIWVPHNYQFDTLLGLWDKNYQYLRDSNRYHNNYDYRLAICLLNPIKFLQAESILLIQNNEINSAIATLHFEYYNSTKEIYENILTNNEKIQCCIGSENIQDLICESFGTSQKPALSSYADQMDTIQFLLLEN